MVDPFDLNVGQEITADQFEPYKHHGSVHKNQIKLKTEETTISATGTKVTVYLEYKDLEQYKEAFLRFVKPFSDTDIEKCWEQVLADDARVIEFDGFSTETSKFNGDIEYIKGTKGWGGSGAMLINQHSHGVEDCLSRSESR